MEKKKHSEMAVAIVGALVGALVSGAIAVIIFVAGNYSTQETLERKTVEMLAGYFDSVDQKMSYKQAMQVIYENSQALKSEYQKGYNQAKTEMQEEAGQKYLEGYEKGKEEAEAGTYQEGYEAGLFAGQGGVIPVGSSSTGQSAKAKNLSDLTPVSGRMDSDTYQKWDVTDIDNYENKYVSGIYLKQYYDKATSLTYALDKKYTKLTGKFVLSQEGKNTDGRYSIIFYSLENDGNKRLLYESPKLSTATRPIDISVDVTGVLDLVIEVYDSNKSGNNAWTAFVNAVLE